MNSNVKVDSYTRVVLTVIAVALCILVGQNMVPTAAAFGQSGCGSSFSPCTINVNLSGYIQ